MQRRSEVRAVRGATARSRRTPLSRLEESLDDQKAFVQAVLETVGALVVVLDRAGRIVLFNRRCQEVTGYTLDEVRGRRFWRLFLRPKEVPKVRAVFERLRTGEFPNRWENHWRTKDGHRRRIAWSNTALSDANGRVTHVVGTGIDVTGQQTRVTHVRTVGEMSAMLAHELNQPLAAIQNYAQGGLRRLGTAGGNSRELGFALQSIAQEAARAGQIVDMVRGLACRQRPRLARVDANDLVREAVRLVEPELRGSTVRLELALAKGELPVAADRVQIEQVLLNLLRNAAEALGRTPARRRWVRVSTRHEGAEFAEVVLHDGGPGLPAGALERVFEPFHTTKSQGMGVGLAICRTIVQSHGGRVWAESPAGGGAAFHFTLRAGGEIA